MVEVCNTSDSWVITLVPVGGICAGISERLVCGAGIKYGFTRGEGNALKYVVYCWKEKKSIYLSMHQCNFWAFISNEILLYQIYLLLITGIHLLQTLIMAIIAKLSFFIHTYFSQ